MPVYLMFYNLDFDRQFPRHTLKSVIYIIIAEILVESQIKWKCQKWLNFTSYL